MEEMEDKMQVTVESKENEPVQNQPEGWNKRPFYVIIYIYFGLFLMMMGYFTYFLIARSDTVVNNAYNKRQDILAQRVIRGQILTSDAKVLAETLYDENGSEYRHYPYEDMFVHVVGRVDKGLSGIELSENIPLLTSNLNTLGVMYNDFVGNKSQGDNVVTTLNYDLQKAAYDALGDNRGSVIVLNPSTGAILAMVSKPAYDPNTINEMWEVLSEDSKGESPFLNRATQGLYPPGSTFKILTTLAYMRQYPNYMDYEYHCTGKIEYQGMVMHCYNGKAHGKVDLMRSFAKSCNTSYAFIGQELDVGKFRTLAEEFLFNQMLPLGMEANQSRFDLKSPGSGVKEVMQTVIGQGNTLITPMHNAMIAAMIANGGTIMKPYAVSYIENAEGGIVKRNSPKVYAQPMKPSEAAYLTGIMNEVVQRGTATELKGLKYRVAGKTGSADVEGAKAHAWFVGFAPVDDPQIAISVIVENKGTGGDYAVPVAKKVFEEYFKSSVD